MKPSVISSATPSFTKSLGLLSALFICWALLHPGKLQAQAGFQLLTGGTQSEGFYSVTEIPGNGYAMVGSTYSFGVGSEDILLVRTDANGLLLWSKTYGAADIDLANSIAYVPGSGFVIAGGTRSFGSNYDGHLLFVDLSGNPIWSFSMPASGQDAFNSVAVASDGGFIVAGTVNDNHCQIKVSSTGTLQWMRSLNWGGSSIGLSVMQTADGGYASAGFVAAPGTGSTDITVLKTNPQGDTLWTRRLGGPGFDEAETIRPTPDGGFIISGNSSNFPGGGREFYFIKLDSIGNVMWSKSGGGVGTDYAIDAIATATGYVFIGNSISFGAGNWDVVVMGADAGGDLLWQNSIGTPSSDYPHQIIATSDGSYAIAGETFGGSLGQSNGFLFKNETAGPVNCAGFSGFAALNTVITPTNNSAPTSVTASALTAITFQTTTPQLSDQSLCLTGIQTSSSGQLTIAPNPFNESITITLNQTVENAVATITNLAGQTVYREALQTGNRFTLQPVLPSGLYLIEIGTGRDVFYREKLVRE